MWIELLFYGAFLSQIWLLSYYYPKRILGRMDYVFKHCPPDTHGKLYPKGYEKALEGKIVYKLINSAIFILGLVALTIVIVKQQGDLTLKDIRFLPLAFGMLQAVPFLLLEISAFKQLKQMRHSNHETKRKADLSPRSMFNYLSPAKFYTAVTMFLVCIYVIFALNDFEVSEDILTLIISMILCNGLFVGLGYFLINGKKLDPHQSPADRHKTITAVCHSYVNVSVLISAFFILSSCVEQYSLDNWAALLHSIYWQAVLLLGTGTMLKSINLEDIDLDVYKTTTSP